MDKVLERCPFCGGEAYVAGSWDGKLDKEPTKWFIVGCKGDCTVRPLAGGNSEAAAVAAWNQRFEGI